MPFPFRGRKKPKHFKNKIKKNQEKSYIKSKLTFQGISCNKWLEVVYQKIGEIFYFIVSQQGIFVV